MIDKLTYDQILAISKELSVQADIIDKLVQNRNIQDLKDFAATVEGYSKFLETTVLMNKDADKALEDLKRMKK
ncbi:MAG: hypothetical protein PUG33_01730 [Mollicutes bacterium]|nr:hypothetical protein [Mollicutes bacterium]MDY5875400.1 hypothetical protein [Bacilli bacterium]